ncbi:MAG: hypothetical protein WCQ60_02120 [bacterium]
MKTKKIQVVVTTIIIVILIVIGILYFSNQKSPVSSNVLPTTSVPSTTSWQTYQNNVYGGIKLSYPNDWSLAFSSSTGIANVKLVNNAGYNIVIELCDKQHCAAAASAQTYDKNTQLEPSAAVSLNISGNQAWRTIDPVLNGEDSDALYFNFTFLRKTAPTTSQTGFNDKTKFTPVSNWIAGNESFYNINYGLPNTVTATNYDNSIINQMDKIVQDIVFGN